MACERSSSCQSTWPTTEIDWVTVRKGFGFTGGPPSTTSIVERSVPVGIPQAEREAYLQKVSNLWKQETGCTTNEILAVTWEGPFPVQL